MLAMLLLLGAIGAAAIVDQARRPRQTAEPEDRRGRRRRRGRWARWQPGWVLRPGLRRGRRPRRARSTADEDAPPTGKTGETDRRRRPGHGQARLRRQCRAQPHHQHGDRRRTPPPGRASGCVNGRTQYGLLEGRQVVPRVRPERRSGGLGQLASIPATGIPASSATCWRMRRWTRCARRAANYKTPECGTGNGTRERTRQQPGRRSSPCCPTQPNERLVYDCHARWLRPGQRRPVLPPSQNRRSHSGCIAARSPLLGARQPCRGAAFGWPVWAGPHFPFHRSQKDPRAWRFPPVLRSSLAGRYASALFDLASEAGTVSAVEADLDKLRAALAESAELLGADPSIPKISRADLGKAVAALAEQAASSAGLTTQLPRRAGEQPPPRPTARDDPRVPRDRRRPARRSDRRSRERPSARQGAARHARSRSSRPARAATSEVRTRVDPDLLGGLVVTIGSKRIDSSIRTRLNPRASDERLNMDIRAAEISKVIKDQIANFGTEAQVSEVGTVLSRRRRHRPHPRPRQCPGRRDGRVRQRRAGHGAQPRSRQRRRRDLRLGRRDQGRRQRQAHRHHRGRAGRQGPARPRGRRASATRSTARARSSPTSAAASK